MSRLCSPTGAVFATEPPFSGRAPVKLIPERDGGRAAAVVEQPWENDTQCAWREALPSEQQIKMVACPRNHFHRTLEQILISGYWRLRVLSPSSRPRLTIAPISPISSISKPL